MPARSPRLAPRCGRRSSAPPTSRLRPRPRAVTQPPRDAGCSCGSSGRRRGSRAPRPTRRSPSTAWPRERSPPPQLRRPSASTCSTPTTAAYAPRSTRSARRRSPASTSVGQRPPRRAAGYWRIVRPTYRAQRGPARAAEADALFARLVREATAGSAPSALVPVERALEGFRAAPLADAEQLRRAGQLLRFVELVPIEYGRGVEDGRVVLDFEIQEAITFRDGAAAAFADLESILLRRDAAATRGLKTDARVARRRARRRDARRRGRGPRDGRSDRRRGAPPRRRRSSRSAGARRPRPPTSTSSRRRSTASRRLPPRASGGEPSRRASRRTASSSSGRSSGCEGSRRASSRRSRRSSGTATGRSTGSSSS